uniref:Uncharacterized protein n=1 Tax=Rhizophora mucronata TaxID=61149 RepID=A0A2P2L6N7_RHIMU
MKSRHCCFNDNTQRIRLIITNRNSTHSIYPIIHTEKNKLKT